MKLLGQCAAICQQESGGQYDLALADYDKAIELDPNDATAVYNKACAYSLLMDAEQACVWLRRACQMAEEYVDMAWKDSDFDPIRDAVCF